MVSLRSLLRHLPYLAAALVSATTAATPAIELEPIKVSEHVYYFRGEPAMASAANRGFNSNAAFVVTDDGVVVFDALGTPALGAAMKRAIARVTPQPIRVIIVSHFHADHFYGLQSLAGSGVEIWAHGNGRETLGSPFTQDRLEQRRRDLAPEIGPDMRLVAASRWLVFEASRPINFERGGVRFRLLDVSGAHSGEDIMLWVDTDRVLLAGDLYFSGRLPFVGNANSKKWLTALDLIAPLDPAVVVPGHGTASSTPQPDIALTREYLQFLRAQMGAAVRELVPFDEAYQAVDWSRFKNVPAFDAANRINAYGTYLHMEQEALEQR